jgi:hypothetical protein
MGVLNHLGDPTITVTPLMSDLVRRLREIVQADDLSDTWTCQVANGQHGFSVRLDHAPMVKTPGRRGLLVYECDGSADGIVNDFKTWLASQPVSPS